VTIRGSRLVIAWVHLSGDETERLGHADELHRPNRRVCPPGCQ
jgi:hypothetical protein